jgi:hypothetical protein
MQYKSIAQVIGVGQNNNLIYAVKFCQKTQNT